MRLTNQRRAMMAAVVLLGVLAGACAKKQPPIARPAPPPPPSSSTSTTPARPPAPPEPVSEPTIPTPAPLPNEGDLGSRSLDDLNRESPFKPVFYDFDSTDLNASGQAALNENAELMKRYPSWVVTVEGHCDERGTTEYNLHLGERRAEAVRKYLVNLGMDRKLIKAVSYGEERPLCTEHDEACWAKNRRGVVTATGTDRS